MVKDMALVGVGVVSCLLYQKYVSKMVDDTFNMITKEVEKATRELNQMM